MNTRTCAMRLVLASTLTLGALLAVATLPSRAATDPATAPLSRQAAVDPAAQPLETLDSDRDGTVSAPEVGTWLRAHGDRSPLSTAALGAASIARMDRNGDGNYTLADRAAADPKVRTLIEWQGPATRATDRVAVDEDEE
jgi:hypothetical protein